MTNRILYRLGVLMLLIVFTQCSIQKRTYRPGYYLSWKKAPVKRLPIPAEERAPVRVQIHPVTVQGKAVRAAARNVKGLTASASAEAPNGLPVKIAPLPVSLDSCGDQIVFRNGDELDARILEIGSDYIKYKTCDNLSGPLRVSSLEKIFMLRFMDGKRKLIEQKKSIAKSDQGPSGTRTLSGSNHTQRSMGRNNSDKLESGITSAYAPVDHQKKRELYTGALGAFILSLFSWTLILAPVAFILSILSLNKINQEPDKYKGTGFALFGLIISLIAMLMILSLIF